MAVAPARVSLCAVRCAASRQLRARALPRRGAAAMAAAKRVLVPIGNGSEARRCAWSLARPRRVSAAHECLINAHLPLKQAQEIEAVCVVDVLRRAGADVTLASVEATLLCKMSRGVQLQADALLSDVAAAGGAPFDLIALPGGMPGAERLRDSAPLAALLAAHASAGLPYAAMCAAPAVVLGPAGLLAGRAATAHPAFVAKLPAPGGADVAARVVVDGPLVTSRGPGTALEFSLALVALLFGQDKAREVAAPMVMPPQEGLPPPSPHEWRL